MLDNGFPLATESNVLKELIRPPNILRTLTDTVTGKSTKLVQLSALVIHLEYLFD
jgi:AP-3 complex subunit mu